MSKRPCTLKRGGGKYKLFPLLMPHVEKKIRAAGSKFTLVEPFAGGFHIAAGMLCAGKNPERVLLNDLDHAIFSYLKIYMQGESEKLCRMVEKHSPATVDMFREAQTAVNSGQGDFVTLGFQMFFLSRTAWGAIGAGPKGGWDQGGRYKINDRYNTKSLVKQIRQTASLFSKTNLLCTNKGYEQAISMVDSPSTVVYLDPPYIEQGSQLYRKSMDGFDFERMASVLRRCKSKWVLSHEEHPMIHRLFGGFADIITLADCPRQTDISGRKKVVRELVVVSRD